MKLSFKSGYIFGDRETIIFLMALLDGLTMVGARICLRIARGVATDMEMHRSEVIIL